MCHFCIKQQCCCGCIQLYYGVIIWAIVDIIFNTIAFSIYCIFIGIVAPQVSIVFVTMADTFLIIGAYIQNTDLILIWILIILLYIVFLFTLWVALPIIVRYKIHLYFT